MRPPGPGSRADTGRSRHCSREASATARALERNKTHLSCSTSIPDKYTVTLTPATAQGTDSPSTSSAAKVPRPISLACESAQGNRTHTALLRSRPPEEHTTVLPLARYHSRCDQTRRAQTLSHFVLGRHSKRESVEARPAPVEEHRAHLSQALYVSLTEQDGRQLERVQRTQLFHQRRPFVPCRQHFVPALD